MNNKKDKYLFILLNVFCWFGIILLSFFTIPHKEKPDTFGYLLRMSVPASMCIIFYFNYLWLVPYSIEKKKRSIYLVLNILMIVILSIFLHQCMVCLDKHEPGIILLIAETPKDHIMYVVRKMPVLILSAGIATLIAMSVRWNHMEMDQQRAEVNRQQAELAQKEAETGRVAAELKALQTQISPHVMLNTLNNIYALIAFDKEKAQRSVVSLSKLLGFMLYTRQDSTVNLREEVELLQHFIELMKIRLPDNVKLDVDFQLPDPCSLRIAPLIFVSLIENAFKYGVSATEPSFINISLKAEKDRIDFNVRNSYHPSLHVKSSHGVGLEQVAKRLELLYPGKYEWKKGIDEKQEIYYSNIIIYDTDMCHY